MAYFSPTVLKKVWDWNEAVSGETGYFNMFI
jgi:hypothetical protein